ncbi:MAG: 1-deoxy-D-xylulose-5-phosphate synthase, partial [Lachnospiraceae bacterium]|nr:1-deoxy-D-xylulose-5-phosphate synthase [Lachnospiraceae bacterium]
TGRAEGFDTLRQYGGMSGFPKRRERNTDLFDSGHSSNSISEACGLVRARELSGGKEKVVAVIGDGAMTGGLAYEGLNNAGQLKSNLILVLNDNEMSIAKNVGGMASYLGKIRTSTRYGDLKDDVTNTLEKIPLFGEKLVRQIRRSKASLKQLMIPGMYFEEMNITYVGPIDGHNIQQMYEAFLAASRKNGTVLVHVITKKGKGYDCAEHDPGQFHGVDAFDVETGKSLKEKQGDTYTDVFAAAMNELAVKYRNLVAITAAMPDGTGLAELKAKYPRRVFDAGSAEEHAVSFAAGLAAGGYHPVFAVYSTFLQRAYDQILHDVCLNRFPVTFAIDRAGIVGSDGETHQGIFDISYLTHIPGLVVMAPKNAAELKEMLEFCITCPEPTAIRYPRGEAGQALGDFKAPLRCGECEWIIREGEVLLLAVGSMVEVADQAVRLLAAQGIRAALVNVRFLAPVDMEMLDAALSYPMVVTLEENVMRGGFGEEVARELFLRGFGGKFLPVALPDRFIEHGSQAELRRVYGLDAEGIAKSVREAVVGGDGVDTSPEKVTVRMPFRERDISERSGREDG